MTDRVHRDVGRGRPLRVRRRPADLTSLAVVVTPEQFDRFMAIAADTTPPAGLLDAAEAYRRVLDALPLDPAFDAECDAHFARIRPVEASALIDHVDLTSLAVAYLAARTERPLWPGVR